MSQELFWMSLTALLIGLIWVPYILNRFVERGIFPAIIDVNADPTPTAGWAKRLMNAHGNAVENMAVFAPLAIAVHLTGTSTGLTAAAAMIYFYARLAHVVVYALGIPVVRTLTFMVGFACQLILGLTLLGLM